LNISQMKRRWMFDKEKADFCMRDWSLA